VAAWDFWVRGKKRKTRRDPARPPSRREGTDVYLPSAETEKGGEESFALRNHAEKGGEKEKSLSPETRVRPSREDALSRERKGKKKKKGGTLTPLPREKKESMKSGILKTRRFEPVGGGKGRKKADTHSPCGIQGQQEGACLSDETTPGKGGKGR